MESFKDFELKSELLRAVEDCGFENPSDVQEKCIPQACQGKDVICQARAGTGKTTLCALAILQQLQPIDGQVSVLILCHTRELALATSMQFKRLTKYLNDVKTAVFYGGMSIKKDETVIRSDYPHIVIGTPGRIFALIEGKLLNPDGVRHLIIDECDQLLQDIDRRRNAQKIFHTLPQEKQVMMFSPHIPKEMWHLCRKFTKDPLEYMEKYR